METNEIELIVDEIDENSTNVLLKIKER